MTWLLKWIAIVLFWLLVFGWVTVAFFLAVVAWLLHIVFTGEMADFWGWVDSIGEQTLDKF